MLMDIDEIVENFEYLEDWEDRYRYIIDLGRGLPLMDESDKNDRTKVQGCMSQVWMVSRVHPESTPPTITFLADSDAHIVKGLIAILLAVYSGKTPREIMEFDIEDAFGRLGLDQHLSPNRRNGFYAMVERIREAAAVNA